MVSFKFLSQKLEKRSVRHLCGSLSPSRIYIITRVVLRRLYRYDGVECYELWYYKLSLHIPNHHLVYQISRQHPYYCGNRYPRYPLSRVS